jgi:urease accessory protein
MRRAVRLHARGTWAEDRAAATVTLAWNERHRRRIGLTDDGGEAFLLDLPDAAMMGDGDGLELAEGGFITVKAALEDVAEISTVSSQAMARLAWHVGNRHTPVQILADGRLRLAWDHVLVAMAEGLGAHVERRRAPFQPEGGAYAAHGHD